MGLIVTTSLLYLIYSYPLFSPSYHLFSYPLFSRLHSACSYPLFSPLTFFSVLVLVSCFVLCLSVQVVVSFNTWVEALFATAVVCNVALVGIFLLLPCFGKLDKDGIVMKYYVPATTSGALISAVMVHILPEVVVRECSSCWCGFQRCCVALISNVAVLMVPASWSHCCSF